MEKVIFMNTADWHIRDLQYGRGFRGEDYRRSIRQVIEIAIQNNVDFIINGGDTLHMNRPSETMLEFLFEVHERLKGAGIPMYTVTGNHDNSEPSFLTFPSVGDKEVVDTRPEGIVCIDYKTVEHKGVTIAGYPACSFDAVVKDREGKPTVDILVWHGALDEFVPFPMKDSGSMAKMPPDAARAWLLGDIHLRDRKRLDNGALVSYPGPVELCERGEKALKYVDIYELSGAWREAPFPDPVEIELETRPVIFLSVADEAQADQALSKIRQCLLENPDRAPLIFARHDKTQKGFVQRVNELIDPSQTVFRAAAFSNSYRSLVSPGINGARPELAAVVDEVLPSGNPVNALAHQLIMPDAQHRHVITTWVENMLSPDKSNTTENV